MERFNKTTVYEIVYAAEWEAARDTNGQPHPYDVDLDSAGRIRATYHDPIVDAKVKAIRAIIENIRQLR